jgi:hypothetical protein
MTSYLPHGKRSSYWGNLKGTETRGVTKDVDLGEVQEIGENFVLTEKGTISKEKYFVPKYLVEGYDGHTLGFASARVKNQDSTGTMPPYMRSISFTELTNPILTARSMSA